MESGGSKQRAGDGDNANKERRKYLDNGDDADKSWRQCTGDRDDVYRATLLPQAAEGAALGGGGSGCRWQGPK